MKRRCSFVFALCTILGGAAHAAAAPERIVSLKPTITDVIVALGMDERLVGVTRYCDVPPHPDPLPTGERGQSFPSPLPARRSFSGGRGEGRERGGPEIIGDYTQPSLERIIALAPDLILGSRENSSRRSVEKLGRMGMRIELFPFSTVAETLSSIRGIAELVGVKGRGEELARRMEGDLAALRERWTSAATLRTVVVWGVRPLIVAGPGTYIDELLGSIGAVNAVTGTRIAYPRLGLEEMIALDPDAIVDLSMGSEAPPHPDPLPTGEREQSAPGPSPLPARRSFSGGRGEGRVRGGLSRPWDGVTQLRAVREGRVVALDASLFRAGPKLPASLAKLAEMLHTP